MTIIQEYYEELYSLAKSNLTYEHLANIRNVGSEDVSEINIQEIKLVLKQLRTGRAPGEDGVTTEMLRLGGDTALKAVETLLNKCLQSGEISKQ